MAHVTFLDRISDLDDFHLVWRRLWQDTRNATFFQTLEWLKLYWSHFQAGQLLRVAIVESRGEIQGIVPLVVRTETTKVGSVRVLTYPLADWGSFYGPLGSNPTASLVACLRALHERPRDWDLLDLRWVNQLEVDQGRTPVALEAAGFPATSRVWRTTALIDFAGNWSDYLASRSSKFRNNLRRAETAAAKAGSLTFHRYRPAAFRDGGEDPDWDLFHECVGVAADSWQGSSQSGTTLSHLQVRDFFRDLFGLAAHHGALDVNLLRMNGELIAFTFNLHSRGNLQGLRLGYSPEWAAISPGRLIMARSVEDSLNRGDHRLDLGGETMSFKRPWLTRTLDSYRHTHYPLSSWRSQVLRLKHVWNDRKQEHPTSAKAP